MGTCHSSRPSRPGMWRGELICLPPPTSLELGHGYRGARTTDNVDISTPSAFPKVSTTSDVKAEGVRGHRVLTLVVMFPHITTTSQGEESHNGNMQGKPSMNEAGPYPLRLYMHQSMCAWHATLLHYHSSLWALRDTARRLILPWPSRSSISTKMAGSRSSR
jgi:hypothetical protein